MTIFDEVHYKMKEEFEEDRRHDMLQSVILIIKGYEWDCPGCGRKNTEVELLEEVECHNCDTMFNVSETLY